jgi:hypothetical protein
VRSLGTESTVLCIQTIAMNVVGSFKDAGHDDVHICRRSVNFQHDIHGRQSDFKFRLEIVETVWKKY